MTRERALRVVLVLAGLLFVAGAVPLVMFFTRAPGAAMVMSLYVPLGVFLVMAAREPAAHRSLIAFAGWANIAHAGVMAVQLGLHAIGQEELGGVAIFGVAGLLLLALGPGKQVRELAVAGGE